MNQKRILETHFETTFDQGDDGTKTEMSLNSRETNKRD